MGDVNGTGGPMKLVLDVKDVVAKVVFGGRIRFPLEKFCESSQSPAIRLLRTGSFIVKLEVVQEADSDGRSRIEIDRHSGTFQVARPKAKFQVPR